jgi:hypothetical protein
MEVRSEIYAPAGLTMEKNRRLGGRVGPWGGLDIFDFRLLVAKTCF